MGLPGSSVHGILQTRILEWVAMPSSRGSSQPRNWTQVSRIAGGFFIIWATKETLENNTRSISVKILRESKWCTYIRLDESLFTKGYFERANRVREAEQFSRMNKVRGAVTTSGLKGIRTVSHCRIRIRKKESPVGYRRLPSGNIAKEAQEVPLSYFFFPVSKVRWPVK